MSASRFWKDLLLLVLLMFLCAAPLVAPAGAQRLGEGQETSPSIPAWGPKGGSWQVQTVDTAGSVGLYTSLALDTAGYPHISYYDASNYDLEYAYKDSAGWHFQTVTSAGDAGAYSSLGLAANGYPGVAYYLGSPDYDLYYAYKDGSGWHTELADNGGTGRVGQYASLALDAAGYPHVSYYDYTNSALKYAYKDEAGWHTLTVDSPGTVGWDTSLALDGSGDPHIGYYDYTNTDLKYAHYVGSGGNCGPGNTWSCETVDNYLETGRYSSLALDPLSGQPHISYFQTSYGLLRYARRVGSGGNCGPGNSWRCETVYDIGSAGGYTSLAIDENSLPHIAYYFGPTRDLQYAYLDGTAWYTETVDSSGDVGMYASLALDDDYWVHISYYAATGADLKYARGCQAVREVAISGPALLEVGEIGAYTASFHPLAATRPVTLTWDNGTIGPTATYSWTQPGVYTISITATSPCGGMASTTYTVRVCQPVQQATVSGPNWLLVGDPGTYTAGYLPGNATPPITFTWDSGSEGPTAIYSWSSPGARSVSVTATNLCGLAVSSPYAVTVCQPVTAASISGPPMLWVGKEGTYAAGFLPSNATLPVTFTWDNGTVGPTANYRWYDQGTHTIAVTATNPCGLRVRTTYNVTVCQPVQEVTIQGPVALLAGQAGKYTASYLPLTATLPVALTWNNGTVGPTAWYSWPDPGTHLVVVTATNSCQGEARAVYTVTVGVCRSVDQVTVSGPDMLVVGQDGTYTAGYLPGNATPPITFAWDNGTIGSSAVYGWPSPGMRSIVVTATNPCGERASAPYGVKVCQPVQTVTVSGPTVLKVGQAGTYGAGYSPVTTSLPITITWSNGTVGPTAIYSWPTVGTRMITATVANSCGVVRRSLAVSVWFQIYLPLATWNWNRCHLAPGSFGEVEPNDNPGSANGPLCSDTAYNAQPNDANDYFSFPCGIETVRVRVTNYAPGVHGQLLVYDGEDWICWDSGCEYGVCDCAGSTGDGGTCYARVYTDPLFTSSAWYTLRAIFRGY